MQAGQWLTDSLVLERMLGAGAMGQVWLARSTTLGSPVAVKVITSAVGPRGREALGKRFAQETAVLRRLSHPNIVALLDAGTTAQGDPFVVTELLDGEDLDHVFAREGMLSLESAVAIVRQVCAALEAAAAAGVVHRDIKPANLFLRRGVPPVVKVLDFGVAKITQEDAGLTASGALVGTISYMSPEQLRDAKRVDGRSDLWSLGVVLYRALTGVLPFDGATPIIAAVAIARGAFTPPSAIRRDLPHTVDALVARALALDPSRRFQTPLELSEALSALAPNVSRAIDSSAATVSAPLRASTSQGIAHDPTAYVATPAPTALAPVLRGVASPSAFAPTAMFDSVDAPKAPVLQVAPAPRAPAPRSRAVVAVGVALLLAAALAALVALSWRAGLNAGKRNPKKAASSMSTESIPKVAADADFLGERALTVAPHLRKALGPDPLVCGLAFWSKYTRVLAPAGGEMHAYEVAGDELTDTGTTTEIVFPDKECFRLSRLRDDIAPTVVRDAVARAKQKGRDATPKAVVIEGSMENGTIEVKVILHEGAVRYTTRYDERGAFNALEVDPP